MWRSSQYRRLWALGILLALGFGAVDFRLYRLQVARHAALARKARGLTELRETLVPWRGDIVARDGAVLVTTAPVKAVYLDLALCEDRVDLACQAAASILGMEPREVRGRVVRGLLAAMRKAHAAPAGAVRLRRDVQPGEWVGITNALARASFGFNLAKLSRTDADRLTRLQGGLLFARDDQERCYPFVALACHALGSVIPDEGGFQLRGASGVELGLDSVLAGQPGRRISERDVAGRELPSRRILMQPALDGRRVMLALDPPLQRIAEAELAEVVRNTLPANASVLIVCPQTGEILAWACWPGFECAAPARSSPETWLNRPLWAVVEPGSTFKAFTLAIALEEGLVTLDQLMDGGHGHLQIGREGVSDHGQAYAWVPMRTAFAKSLNTVHARLALAIGRERFCRYLTNFGFGQVTGIPLPGERPGNLGALTNRANAAVAYAGFGQGIAVTQLQMTMAFCALVNGGWLLHPQLVERIEETDGRTVWQARPTAVRRVIGAATSQAMREALRGVVAPGGTGTAAAVPDGDVGGKTGTAQKARRDERGYSADRFYASFIGCIPVEQPALVIAVAVDEPQGAHTGGAVAAPVFRRVAEQAMRCLGWPAAAPPLLSSSTRPGRAMAGGSR